MSSSMLRVPALTALWLLLLLVQFSSARVQHPADLTLADAINKSRAVVAARVVDVRVEANGWIQTVVEFETFAVGKGESPGRFTYRMMGGRSGNTQTMSGEPLPRFTPGEEVVLLLASQTAPDGNPTIFRRHVYRVRQSGSEAREVLALPADASIAATNGQMPLDRFLNLTRTIR